MRGLKLRLNVDADRNVDVGTVINGLPANFAWSGSHLARRRHGSRGSPK